MSDTFTDCSDLLGGDFIKKLDVELAPYRGRITSTDKKTFPIKTGGTETKAFVSFQDGKKFILNKTNLSRLAKSLGTNPQLWRGAVVELSFDPEVRFGSSQVGGVRLRVLRLPDGTSPGESRPPTPAHVAVSTPAPVSTPAAADDLEPIPF